MITPLTLTKKNNMLNSSTIAAISTPPGKGGVAVIRISGDDALSVGEKIFRPKGKPIRDRAPRTQIFGYILSGGEEIDDGLLTYFPENSSYTGEQTIEISCHGGILITKAVLEAALTAGARHAEPGEFTKRAFMNGRLSLTDTEAIGLLLEAESEAQIKLTRKASRSALDNAIEGIRESLTSLLSSIYARIDYPDEDLGDYTDSELCDGLASVISKMDLLLNTYRTGKAVTEGVKTVIAGKPNVGKSSLYNLLAGYDAAIVTDIPGTTRDTVEDTLVLGGMLFRFIDTAGMRQTDDTIESLGIERSRQATQRAAVIIHLQDATQPVDILSQIEDIQDKTIIHIYNKVDLVPGFMARENSIGISAKNGEVEAIKQQLVALAAEQYDTRNAVTISNTRHYEALVRALEAIKRVQEGLQMQISGEFLSMDLQDCLAALGEITGQITSQEVLNTIFGKFCIGK